jgi:hypothetical protein
MGTCTINANQAGDGTYAAATQVQKSFGVSLKDNTITFPLLIDSVIGGEAPKLTATASSGLAVSYSSSTAGICTTNGTTITLLSAGTCIISASQAGNGTYAIANTVSKSFNITNNSSANDAAAAAEVNRLLYLKLLHATANTAASHAQLAVLLLTKLESYKCFKGKVIKYVNPGTKCPVGYVRK